MRAAAIVAGAAAACHAGAPEPPGGARSVATPASAGVKTSTDSARDAARAGVSDAGAPRVEDAAGAATSGALDDDDGDDDPPADVGASASLPARGRFVRVGRSPLALRRVCDLTAFGGALYAAHANEPLGTDGATITKLAGGKFSVAFDWNRPGEPTRGGGAGQGFLRVHAIGGRLVVPDADPPYAGFGIADHGTEGFVYLSDPGGRFAPARGEHFRPPGPPTPDGGAGAAVLPRAYHVIDAIRFRGRLRASTGSVPPTERAWHGASPGALHVANDALSRWTYEVDYPFPWQDGVWRLTFLVRFHDRLYAGIQDYDGREPNDYVVVSPPPGVTTLAREHVHPARVTPNGGAETLRWYVDRATRTLFWVTLDRGGKGSLRATTDGATWKDVALPPEAGRPSDVTRFAGALVVMTEGGLYRLDPATLTVAPTPIAAVATKKSPFVVDDFFCAAPLAVFEGALYAGGQRDGALYRLTEDDAKVDAGAP